MGNPSSNRDSGPARYCIKKQKHVPIKVRDVNELNEFCFILDFFSTPFTKMVSVST